MAVSKDLPGSHQAQVHSTSAEGFNTRELRNALGSFATGVTIITTRDRDGTPHGMTANSFSSVSLNPPLVLWSSSLYAQSLPAFQESPHFCVNILAYDQIELSNKFAKQADDKFVDVDHIIPESGARSSSVRRRISSAATNSAITAETTSSLSAMSSALLTPTSRPCC